MPKRPQTYDEPPAPAGHPPDVMPRVHKHRTYVPFYSVHDPLHDVEWRLQNSPYYIVDEYLSYQLLESQDNTGQTSSEGEARISFSKTKSSSWSSTEEFSTAIGITVGAEGGGLKAETKATFGYKESSTEAQSASQGLVSSVPAPNGKVTRVWELRHDYELRRANELDSTDVIQRWSQVFDEVKVVSSTT